MKKFATILSAAAFALAIGGPSSFAQSTSPSASESMHEAGQEMKNAGSDTMNAAENVGHGAKTAVKDTTITAKVKKDLHGDETTKAEKIHVSTSAGVVTLKGHVDSQAAADRAVQIAQNVEGVKSVDNRLAIAGSASSRM
ncbi:MAG TPA: BON domain-containing protein [Candidatus Binataceae bacterium]|nr:BON domain-containing protein [Candidatus Binataceae bacterium]